MPPKYTLPEIERRWLVQPGDMPVLVGLARREIEDLYLSGGRLRLRAVHAAGTDTVFKLGKKYGRVGAAAEAVANLYLTEPEYRALQALAGAVVRKTRYGIAGGALDVYQQTRFPLAIFEVEFTSPQAAAAFTPPGFAGTEVTLDARYSGHAIAQWHAPGALQEPAVRALTPTLSHGERE